MHTTASDGRLSPAELVAHAAAAGLSTIAVTDHDTTAGLARAGAAAASHGLTLVNGIEITAVERGRDIHVLGYFMDVENPALIEFLREQRRDRLRRVLAMADLLDSFGMPVDVEELTAEGSKPTGKTIGRPVLADALVAAGHVANRREAFDRWLGQGKPAFIRRSGWSVAEVVDLLRIAGGVSSLAHPGLTSVDEWIPSYADAGLTALEVWHGDHDALTQEKYFAMATHHGLAMSGGSDFHADLSHHAAALGGVNVPASAFEDLAARVPRAGTLR